MKRSSILLSLLFLGLTFAAFAGVLASFKWVETTKNLGKIPQGKPVPITYEFTNTGNEPLKITQVTPACGCTVADYTKEAVAPGKKGFVKGTFNAAAVGTFNKSLTVVSNASEGSIQLTFSGEVVASSAKPAK